jgi:hypothetical protein
MSGTEAGRARSAKACGLDTASSDGWVIERRMSRSWDTTDANTAAKDLGKTLKLSRSELQLETIVSRIAAGELDLQPDFQRGEIWDRRRRQRLIDTILREWYVPAVHIVQDEDGTEVVLDGQQRLAAIRDFFGDRFPVDGQTEPQSEEIIELHGKKFSQLPEQVRRSIRRFVLPVVTLTEFKPQEPNELFFRLNQSYNLTPPEKRNALHGPARDRVRVLVERLEGAGLLVHDVIGFSNGRLAYDDIIARTCVALEHNNLRIHIDNNVVEEFYRNDDFSERTIQRVQYSGLTLLTQIRQCPGRVRFNKGSLFTWLIYLDWAQVLSTAIPVDLLANFEADRFELRRGEYDGKSAQRRRALDCIALYEDRVSYRVTDVSSVLIRDLMLHLYSCLTFGTEPVGAADLLLSQLKSQPGVPLQAFVTEFLDTSRWGADLGGAEA